MDDDDSLDPEDLEDTRRHFEARGAGPRAGDEKRSDTSCARSVCFGLREAAEKRRVLLLRLFHLSTSQGGCGVSLSLQEVRRGGRVGSYHTQQLLAGQRSALDDDEGAGCGAGWWGLMCSRRVSLRAALQYARGESAPRFRGRGSSPQLLAPCRHALFCAGCCANAAERRSIKLQ